MASIHATFSARRTGKWLGFAALGWLAIEFFLFWLCVDRLGLFPTLLFLMAKGCLGFFLLAFKLRQVLGGFHVSRLNRGATHFASGAFLAAGAFLILIPGFVSTFAGLALFSPSLRAMILRKFRKGRGKPDARDRHIDLNPAEWREVSRRKRPARKPDSKSIAP